MMRDIFTRGNPFLRFVRAMKESFPKPMPSITTERAAIEYFMDETDSFIVAAKKHHANTK